MHTVRDNYALGCAGLAEGTNANTFKTSNNLHYQIDGRSYFKAATDNVAFALQAQTPAASIVPLVASQVACLFIMIDPAGALTYKQSTAKPSTTASTYQPGAFEWPQEDKGFACIGAIKIATNASGAFTAASTDLGASNQTVTYYNTATDYGVSIPY